MLHPRVRARAMRLLPEGHGDRPARIGRHTMSDYSVVRRPIDGIDVVRLVDGARNVELAVAPAIGNTAFEWKVRGRNYLYFPYPEGPAEFARKPKFCGVPFLAPWANRIQGDSYWA